MGIVLKSFREIGSAVERMLEPATFAELRANASKYKNNALYEIPEFLEEIAQRKERRVTGQGSPVTTVQVMERAAWSSLARMETNPA
jgi:hypothetical protein